MKVTAYVALGANLGDPVATVRSAFTALRGIPATHFLAASSLYRTAPVGLRHQPDFINAVAVLEVDNAVLPAPTLLEHLLAIEADFGRIRKPGSLRDAPRTLDLDLLLYGDQTLDLPGLKLPHPRIAERAFVLAPLDEIAPGLRIPGHGCIADLLPTVAGQKIARLA